VLPAAESRAPGRFRAPAPHSDKVRLAWSARQQDIGYKLRISESSRVWVDLVDLMPGTSEFTVTHLKPGTTYYFQAGAVVPSGRTLWSVPLKVVTPMTPDAPSVGSKTPTGPPNETAVP
jgi:hypothetical protein